MHTAKVVGKDGEEIDTDEYGRIRVKFFWDQRKEFSRWMRVAHLWASKQWGAQFIPRVGMEVVVDYEDGDPDFPMVIGAVYNGDNKHPYKLPDNKTQSGIKSNSSKGGNGYNELMFEDKKGSEKIRMHAQKDYDVTVHHVETRKIGEDGVSGRVAQHHAAHRRRRADDRDRQPERDDREAAVSRSHLWASSQTTRASPVRSRSSSMAN